MVRYLLIIVFFSSIAQSLFGFPAAVILNTHTSDDFTGGNPMYYEHFIFERLRQRFPGIELISIDATSSSSAQKKIKEAITPDMSVYALVILSHGISYLERNTQGGADTKSYLSNGKQFEMSLQDKAQVEQIFDPILQHWASRALLVFEGCELLREGTLFQKYHAITEVAENFKLSSGSIYMNETAGVNFRDTIAGQPFHQQNSLKRSALVFLAQMTAPVSYPISWLQENFLYNQGYTLESYPHGRYELYRDSFFNVQKNPMPQGPLLLTGEKSFSSSFALNH